MRHCRGCSHPTICNAHGCGVEEAKARREREVQQAQAKAQADADALDAKRYRWLKGKSRSEMEYWGIEFSCYAPTENLDECIDAAMQAIEGKDKP